MILKSKQKLTCKLLFNLHSVFKLVFKTKNELKNFKTELRQQIEPDNDIHFYHLCASCRKKFTTVDNKNVANFPMAVVI